MLAARRRCDAEGTGWPCAGAELSSCLSLFAMPSCQLPAWSRRNHRNQCALNYPGGPIPALIAPPRWGIARACDVPPCQTTVGKLWARGWAQLLLPFQCKIQAKDDQWKANTGHQVPNAEAECQSGPI